MLQETELSLDYRTLCRRQVEWYLKHGQFGHQRIDTDNEGIEYVIGDVSWNCRNNQYERIEGRTDFQRLAEKG